MGGLRRPGDETGVGFGGEDLHLANLHPLQEWPAGSQGRPAGAGG